MRVLQARIIRYSGKSHISGFRRITNEASGWRREKGIVGDSRREDETDGFHNASASMIKWQLARTIQITSNCRIIDYYLGPLKQYSTHCRCCSSPGAVIQLRLPSFPVSRAPFFGPSRNQFHTRMHKCNI